MRNLSYMMTLTSFALLLSSLLLFLTLTAYFLIIVFNLNNIKGKLTELGDNRFAVEILGEPVRWIFSRSPSASTLSSSTGRYVCACTYMLMRTYIHANLRTYRHTQLHTNTLMHQEMCSHQYTSIHIHTHIRADFCSLS